jgi:hypothetical protein
MSPVFSRSTIALQTTAVATAHKSRSNSSASRLSSGATLIWALSDCGLSQESSTGAFSNYFFKHISNLLYNTDETCSDQVELDSSPVSRMSYLPPLRCNVPVFLNIFLDCSVVILSSCCVSRALSPRFHTRCAHAGVFWTCIYKSWNQRRTLRTGTVLKALSFPLLGSVSGARVS